MSQTNGNNEQNTQNDWWSVGSQTNSQLGCAQNSWSLDNQSQSPQTNSQLGWAQNLNALDNQTQEPARSTNSSCSDLTDNTLTQGSNYSSNFII